MGSADGRGKTVVLQRPGIDDLASSPGPQRVPGCGINPVAYELRTTVAEAASHATGVPATGSIDPIPCLV